MPGAGGPVLVTTTTNFHFFQARCCLAFPLSAQKSILPRLFAMCFAGAYGATSRLFR